VNMQCNCFLLDSLDCGSMKGFFFIFYNDITTLSYSTVKEIDKRLNRLL